MCVFCSSGYNARTRSLIGYQAVAVESCGIDSDQFGIGDTGERRVRRNDCGGQGRSLSLVTGHTEAQVVGFADGRLFLICVSAGLRFIFIQCSFQVSSSCGTRVFPPSLQQSLN